MLLQATDGDYTCHHQAYQPDHVGTSRKCRGADYREGRDPRHRVFERVDFTGGSGAPRRSRRARPGRRRPLRALEERFKRDRVEVGKWFDKMGIGLGLKAFRKP